MTWRERTDCRLCGASPLVPLLELPATPLANEFARPDAEGRLPEQETFPLRLAACSVCGHVQLPVVVDPERLFRDYVYVSGTSPSFVAHFERYAEQCIARHGLEPGDLVVEVGSNDGTLLQFFKRAGMRVLGVDPARDIAERATLSGVETWPEFFDEDTAAKILAERGRARLVVANNVFAHADDLAGIARAVRSVLARDGAFVFEVSYLPAVLDGTLFDTIYHEHLSYHSVGPLVGFFSRLGMSVSDAAEVDTHGGSVRVTVAPYECPLSIRAAALLMREQMGRVSSPETFFAFRQRIDERAFSFASFLEGAREEGKRVAAYGAPAKATTLMYAFGCRTRDFEFVVDDSPHKQGLFTPGLHVPVLPSGALEADMPPDYVAILAWNFAGPILKKLERFREGGGRCVVPLPEFRIV